MGTGYTRQSAGSIITGNVITAAPLNAEFNQLQAAFDSSSGHSHDGTSGEGPQINLVTSVTGTLPVGFGGTGSTTFTDGGILYGGGSGPIKAFPVMGDGAILIGDGVTNPQLISAFTSSIGTLKHEFGGLEADVSAYDGLVKITGGATSAVAAPTGDVVGTSDVQTLTNKTIVFANNTITIASTDLTDTADLTYNADTDASVLGFVVDEDDMASNSATKIPTQQSVKAYVDAEVGAVDAAKLNLTGGTLTGNLTITRSVPILTLADSDDGTRFNFYTNNGTTLFQQSNNAGTGGGNSQILFSGYPSSLDDITYFRVRMGGTLNDILHTGNISSYALVNVVEDTTPQLGGNLDVNSKSIIFPTTTIVDVLDEDNMASNSATALATQQSIKAYVDAATGGAGSMSNLIDDTTPQLGGTLDVNSNSIQFPTTTISDVLDEDNMASNSATALATQQSIKAYVDANAGSDWTYASASASGLDTVNFTGLTNPTEIELTLLGVSPNLTGAIPWYIRLGDSGGLETTGYTRGSTKIDLFPGTNDAEIVYGTVVFRKLTSGNLWSVQGRLYESNSATWHDVVDFKTLSDTLTQLSVYTSNASFDWDAGTFYLRWR